MRSKGVLLIGRSGVGKSTLALQLMSLGAELISDDLTEIYRADAGLHLRCPLPSSAPFGIEAREFGLLSAARAQPSLLSLVVDMERTSAARLPAPLTFTWSETCVPLILKVASPAFPAMLMQYVTHGLMPPGVEP